MSDLDRLQDAELDLALDQAIDALIDDRRPTLPTVVGSEFWAGLESAMALRATQPPAPAEPRFAERLSVLLSEEMPVRAPNGQLHEVVRRRVTTGSAESRPWPHAVVPMSQAVGACAIAGMIAGFVVGGGGSRLAMRIAGELYTREHPGVTIITESSDRPVGSISWSGTIDLMMQGMAYGLLGGLFFYIARRWLPRSSQAAGLAYGMLLFLVAGAAIITAGNDDFERIGSPMLNVLMFSSLFVLYGLAVAPLSAAITRIAPQRNAGAGFGRRAAGWLLALMGVFGLAALVSVVLGTVAVSVGELAGGIDGLDLSIAATVVTLLAVMVVMPVVRLLGGAAEHHLIGADRVRLSTLDAIGRWALRVALVTGSCLILAQVAMILA